MALTTSSLAEAAPPLETANEQALADLRRALELARGFTLLFARANLPALRDALISRLGAELALSGHTVRRLNLRPGDSVLRLLLETERDVDGGSLHVCSLEQQMEYGDESPLVLSHLNLAREHMRAIGCPVVFWLREDALTRVARGAPDFWAWRSGIFEFEPDPALAETVRAQRPLEGRTVEWGNLPSEEKAARIVALEGLLEDYRALGDGEREMRARADLLLELGRLYPSVGRWEPAARVLEESLALFRAVGDRLGEANTLASIGDVHSFRKENDAALETYQQALALFRAVGDRLGEANVYRSLALVEHRREQFEQALALFDQALTLHRAIGDTYSQAVDRRQRADSLVALNRQDDARADLEFALQVYTALGLPYVEMVRERLASL
ncbi:MAG TPA: tetratricopeptide repeat protein [Thermoflexia bacterium]|nr:tetratricopeptide repeat protein [Thermoflexia bacterium]